MFILFGMIDWHSNICYCGIVLTVVVLIVDV